MKNKMLKIQAILLIVMLSSSMALAAALQGNQNKSIEIPFKTWLKAGPFFNNLPVFHDNLSNKFSLDDLLTFDELDFSKLKPKANDHITWHDGASSIWEETQIGENGIQIKNSSSSPATCYLAAYLDIKRWTQGKLSVTSPQVFRIYLDGKLLSTRSSTSKDLKPDTIQLETGKHLLILKTVYDPNADSAWELKASLSIIENFAQPPPLVTLSPESNMTISHLLNGPKATNITISPDGTIAALTVRQALPPSDSSESWVELYRIKDNKLLRTFRGETSISQVNWAPTGQKFSYTSYNKKGGTLWIVNLINGTAYPLIKNTKNLGGHTWAPDSSYIIFSLVEEGKKDRSGVKRIINNADRMPGWRNHSYLYKIELKSGIRQRLTAGSFSTHLNSISPDGKKLLFSRSKVDYTQRPYTITELFALNLAGLDTKLIWSGPWLNSAQWDPDGKKILMLGGPSLFGNIGVNIPRGITPNEYDIQAYLYDPEADKAMSLTKDFIPSINQAIWSRSDNCLYFTATDRSYVRLFRYDFKNKKFFRMFCGTEVIGNFEIARSKPVAVYTGSSASVPPLAYVIDLENKRSSLFQDPSQNNYKNISFNKVERWTFKNKTGVEIEGRIYYPPDFDPKKKYPCIVNYYGGTSPVTRSFGGRYPLNLYAAQGYVVYVLQPSGAVGFGQKFSARHVNDWGVTTAEEIIDGVKKLTASHSFIDTDKIGCIGASYGGFMTMYLQTQTNIFSAAIAHAGISSISSYWGAGYWGYLYSAYATANSFPWNRKDIYTKQSPLFNADKISTPLLLLHGSVDTNVPPGESTQLFTALKLLGREVEYIQILDQNHHIMTYNKRILWTKTILAWFDRWLKNQPEWWNNLYPISE